MPSGSAEDSRFVLSDEHVRTLAEEYGTPLYVVDENHLRDRVRRYISAFKAAYPNSEVTFASKANSTLAVLAIAASEGCLIDVASEGELRAAIKAGVPASKCHVHGNAKKTEEIVFAFEQGVNQIVVDNFAEIEDIAKTPGNCPDLILRLAPGVDPKTHAKISTGQADTKFGFNIVDGSAEKALLRCLELKLPITGFHCHVGSQLLDPEAQINGGQILAEFAKEMKEKHSFISTVLNVGGGMGIRYQDEYETMPVEEYCQQIAVGVNKGLEGSGLAPTLVQEPGRWMIGESGVTIYQVSGTKEVPTKEGARKYVIVDGGLSDNPRPAMYGSPYPVRWVLADGRLASDLCKNRVSGRHCETDLLFDDVSLPGDLRKGDFLQVLCTGAYNSSMASNYNRYQRPATVLIRADGSSEIIQKRESWDSMFEREVMPEGLA